jgi:hypothetical protein
MFKNMKTAQQTYPYGYDSCPRSVRVLILPVHVAIFAGLIIILLRVRQDLFYANCIDPESLYYEISILLLFFYQAFFFSSLDEACWPYYSVAAVFLAFTLSLFQLDITMPVLAWL